MQEVPLRTRLALLGLIALVACTPASNTSNGGAINTPMRPVTDAYFGTQVVDNYRWLENAVDPEVHTWTQAQTAQARAYIDALPYRQALGERLMQLVSATSPSYYNLKSAG